MEGIIHLARVLQDGSTTVRTLIAQGDPHRALAHALWLKGMRHPDGAALAEEARQAIRATSPQAVLVLA